MKDVDVRLTTRPIPVYAAQVTQGRLDGLPGVAVVMPGNDFPVMLSISVARKLLEDLSLGIQAAVDGRFGEVSCDDQG